jgi:hypothetical protein
MNAKEFYEKLVNAREIIVELSNHVDDVVFDNETVEKMTGILDDSCNLLTELERQVFISMDIE